MSVMAEGDSEKSANDKITELKQQAQPAQTPGTMRGTTPNPNMPVQPLPAGAVEPGVNQIIVKQFQQMQAEEGKKKLAFGLRVGDPYGSDIDYYTAADQGMLQNTNPYIRGALTAAAGGDPAKMDDIYAVALGLAASSQYSKPGEGMSLLEAISVAGKKVREGEGGGGGGAYTNVSRNVTLTNEGTARRIIDNALTQYLGRRATPTENRAFLKALNMQERQNPTVSVTKGVASKGGNNSSTTTTGGFDATDFAERFSRSQEGYAEYQAATTYMDMFIKALTDQTRVI